MKLKHKVLIAVSLAWFSFLIITYFASHSFIRHNLLTLENDRASRDISRIQQALNQSSHSLYTYAIDWSHWTDAYRFMEGKDPQFVANNFKMSAFINSNINFISYWDNTSKLIAGKAIDTQTRQYTHFPYGLERSLSSSGSPVKQHKNSQGYILTAQGIMMIASSSVTDSDKKQPPIGMAVFGRLLTPQLLHTISQVTRVNMTLLLPSEIANKPSLSATFKKVANEPAGYLIRPFDNHTLHGFIIIKDIQGKPIGMLQTATTRVIYESGLKMLDYYMACYIGLGILFSCLMLWLLHVLVIKRLESLDQKVAEIGKANAVSQRVEVEGNDEITSLSAQINSMMDTIEEAQAKLEHRVKERTQELQKANIQLQQEIAERKSVQKELTTHKEHLVRLAHYDDLTSLPNRVLFNEMLTKSLYQAKRQKTKLAVLYIDLDKFSKINDALGHPVGDAVLKEIANRFLKTLRSEDVLARLSGNEFVVLLNGVDTQDASSIAEKMLTVCSQPLKMNTHEFVITTSIGICIYPDDGASLEELLKNADMAMYKAKQMGGNTFQYFTKEMNVAAHERIKLEAALRKAISNHEFILYYQPKLQLYDGTIMGVEALVRWENPQLGLISPAKFIPLAEETGLILPIGEWVLREACRTAKAWQEQGYHPITMAVNLSAKQFRHQDIGKTVAAILAETQLEPRYLELEITETAIMDDIDVTIEKLTQLRNSGVKITIDDFGTGYTSISYLKQYPVSTIKIDQSFVKGLPSSYNDASITTAVIALAHSLNIKVVAEGVETPEQLQFLADHDCDMVQGYYLSQPLSEEDIKVQLRKKSSDIIGQASVA